MVPDLGASHRRHRRWNRYVAWPANQVGRSERKHHVLRARRLHGCGDEEYERRQEQLDERLSELEKAPPTSETPGGSESADISGVWTGDPGVSYLIEQSGSAVFFTEQGAYGPSAIGYGTIVGARFTFQFEAVNGTSGTGELTLRSDGSLAGSFTSYQGPSADLRLTR
jgi:hypothetical protein